MIDHQQANQTRNPEAYREPLRQCLTRYTGCPATADTITCQTLTLAAPLLRKKPYKDVQQTVFALAHKLAQKPYGATMNTQILKAHNVNPRFYPEFQALVEKGIRPGKELRTRLKRDYKACLAEILLALSQPVLREHF